MKGKVKTRGKRKLECDGTFAKETSTFLISIRRRPTIAHVCVNRNMLLYTMKYVLSLLRVSLVVTLIIDI